MLLPPHSRLCRISRLSALSTHLPRPCLLKPFCVRGQTRRRVNLPDAAPWALSPTFSALHWGAIRMFIFTIIKFMDFAGPGRWGGNPIM